MDAFFLLSSGAKFDKKRFKKEINLINSKEDSEIKKGDELLRDNALPKELDFFNDEKLIENENSKVSTKVGMIIEEEAEPIKNKTEAAQFRNKNRIKVYGTDVPYPIQSFSELLNREKMTRNLKRSIKSLPYKDITPIQIQAIPVILASRDLLACAPTGTGKTMAFAIPTLQLLGAPSKEGYRAIVISPTRELARQIQNQFLRLAEGTKFKIQLLTKATASSFNQPEKSKPKFDVLVTTPLRLVKAIKEEKVDLSKVIQLVFDEADKLFEMNFIEQIDEIIAACTSPELRKAMFSATIPAGVEKLATTIMHDAVRIVVGNKDGATEIIDQKLVYCGQENGKLIALRRLIKEGIEPPALIFVQSVERAKQLYKELAYDNIHLDVIHAEKTQSQRDTIISRFRKGEIWVLICTDLMGRGLDFKGVNLVINYDFPQTIQSYVHRIGRTGRAGRTGKAVTYFTDIDAEYLRSVANVMKSSGCEVPEWMLQLKKASKNDRIKMKHVALKRDDISGQSTFDRRAKAKKRNIIKNSKETNPEK
ncbi:P-loop containing nucleoside triphosphate hydrolase protein [Neoconidiobolus thromboides FSU 785]|nr:P-loop containing nucleoside triphosphate hydrolase protein [Neoconidiobolus thromboides FSU 785]